MVNNGALGFLFAGRKRAAPPPEAEPPLDDATLLTDLISQTEPDMPALYPEASMETIAETPPAKAAPAPPTETKIGPPHMKPVEAATFERLLRGGITRYLEFGTGGSTVVAARGKIATIVAVESDPAWAQSVRTHPDIAPKVQDGSAAIIHADIGPTKSFGAPASMDHLGRWPSYIRLGWAEWDRRGTMPELVLVDGRYRVAACLSIIVAGALAGVQPPGPIVMLHDVVPERKSYERIFDFFDVVESVETLRVLRQKPFCSPLKAFTAMLQAQFDPA